MEVSAKRPVPTSEEVDLLEYKAMLAFVGYLVLALTRAVEALTPAMKVPVPEVFLLATLVAAVVSFARWQRALEQYEKHQRR